MFQTEVVEKLDTDILCCANFSPENRALYKIMWKRYGRAGQATDGNMAHAHCMLDN